MSNETKQIQLQTVSGYIVTMRLLAGALTTGILIFLGIVVFQKARNVFTNDPDGLWVLDLIASISVGFGMLISLWIRSRRRVILAKGNTLLEGIAQYFPMFLISTALCEAPAFLSLVFVMVGRGQWLYALAAFSLLGIFAHWPCQASLEADWHKGRQKLAHPDNDGLHF